jgi:EVE domain
MKITVDENTTPLNARRSWLAVASADHVARGRAGGFMQVCHGKRGPLSRVKPGDGIVYYSPATHMREGEPLKAFTAIGIVRDGDPYPFDMGGGFTPFRRDVDWIEAEEAPIAPLLDALDLTRGQRNWGAKLRFGLVGISERDFEAIQERMTCAASAYVR